MRLQTSMTLSETAHFTLAHLALLGAGCFIALGLMAVYFLVAFAERPERTLVALSGHPIPARRPRLRSRAAAADASASTDPVFAGAPLRQIPTDAIS